MCIRDRLYAATYQRLYRFAYNYLKDDYLAQDALQETYILVLKNIAGLRNPDLFISWLNQICFRICFQMQKKIRLYRTELTDNEACLLYTSVLPRPSVS